MEQEFDMGFEGFERLPVVDREFPGKWWTDRQTDMQPLMQRHAAGLPGGQRLANKDLIQAPYWEQAGFGEGLWQRSRS